MGIVRVEQLREWSLLDASALTDQELICGLAEIAQAENVLAAVKARMLAQVERRELVDQFGATSTAAWLSDSGRIDPGPARRQVATALALETLPSTAEQFRLGEICAAHAEAIAAAIAAIEDACPHLPETGRTEAEQTLLEVALADTPARVREKGRALLLKLRPDTDGQAAEDTDRNRLELALGRNGRGYIRGDVDALTYDKLQTALNPLCKPVPGPGGEPDPRPAAQRRADGFADLLDAYLGSGVGPGEGGVKPHLILLAGAQDLAGRGTFVHDLDDPDPHGEPPTAADYASLFDAEWPFHLSWTGSVSRHVARMLACDCDVTVVLVDGHTVPLDVGRTERLVTKPIRTALVVRDRGCAMPGCGRPAQWCQAHHIVEWINGGETKLANLVLLCSRHHRLIHRGHWEVFLGEDGHPWFIPPTWVDRERRPVPAHNRRDAGTGTAT